MVSIDNDELTILYDHQLLNVNVNDRIQLVMIGMKDPITRV